MTRALPPLLLLALLLPIASPVARAEEERFEVVFEEEPVPLEALLEKVRKTTRAPLVWDPKSRALKNKEFQGGARLAGTQEEIVEALRDLLLSYELLLVPVGAGENVKLFVRDARATWSILGLRPRFVELDDADLEALESKTSLFVTTTVTVKHIESLGDTRAALVRLTTPQNVGSVTEVPAARAFVLTDFAPRVVAMIRLLRRMDVPAEKRGPETADHEIVYRAFPLEHAHAPDAARVLGQHFGTWRPPQPVSRPGQPRQPRQVPVVTPPPDLHIDADARLNQILVTGKRKNVERVAEVIQTLDLPAARQVTRAHLIRLAHVNAAEAARALTSLVQRAPEMWAGESGEAGELPVIVAEPQTNALLITATPRAAEQLRHVVAALDEAKRPADGE